MNFATVLDRDSTEPLRHQIYRQWREGILAGRFRPGDRVPSTRELASALGVSRSTAAEAWEQLIAEGYLASAHGSGTFVCRELPDQPLIPRPGSGSGRTAAVKLSRYGAGLTHDYRRPEPAPGTIGFAPGIPDRDAFPFAVWRKLLVRNLRHGPPGLFNYVFNYAEGAGGLPRLREQIAAYVARLRAVRCTPQQVIVMNGSQQALDLCARLLIERGDVVAFENPGYQGARRVFESQGARLLPLPIDAEGISLAQIKHAELKHARGPVRAIYVTPSHQFPTGVEMSLARRLELIQFAQASGAVIVEDDYSSEYRYSGPPLPSLQGLASGVPVIYIGTFSKVMFPALRVGYAIVPRQLAARFERAKWLTDRHSAMLEQCALADFLGEGHLDRHIRRMRRLYGQRREVLIDALRRNFGDRAQVLGAAAGMHAMVRFTDPGIGDRAAHNKVQLIGADEYYLSRPPGREFLLGFSAIGERAIREGIKRLAR